MVMDLPKIISIPIDLYYNSFTVVETETARGHLTMIDVTKIAKDDTTENLRGRLVRKVRQSMENLHCSTSHPFKDVQ